MRKSESAVKYTALVSSAASESGTLVSSPLACRGKLGWSSRRVRDVLWHRFEPILRCSSSFSKRRATFSNSFNASSADRLCGFSADDGTHQTVNKRNTKTWYIVIKCAADTISKSPASCHGRSVCVCVMMTHFSEVLTMPADSPRTNLRCGGQIKSDNAFISRTRLPEWVLDLD